jgi:multiple sugar transport system permease protein
MSVPQNQVESQRTARVTWSSRRRTRALKGYAYLAPWIVGFLAFVGGPMVFSLAMSFTRYSVLAPPEFIGIENFQFAMSDQLGLSSLGRSFEYAILAVPVGVVGSLILAILLNQKLIATTAWRTAFYLPTLMPSAAAAILWLWMLSPQTGVVNFLLGQIGVHGPGWFGDANWALPSTVLVGLFTGIGGATMITFLAGLQGVPQELLEACAIDGAGWWGKFWNVTIPMISPVLFFNLVVGIIAALNVFDTAYVATNGGPANATWFISIEIFSEAFKRFNMGYASALAWLLAIIVFILTFIQLAISKRWVFYQGGGREDG